MSRLGTSLLKSSVEFCYSDRFDDCCSRKGEGFFKQVRSVCVSRFDHGSQVFIDQKSLTDFVPK